jgi:hypothetical protein
MPLNPCFLGYFGGFLDFLLTALSQVRVLPGELLYFLRKKATSQLTPVAEISAAGRFTVFALSGRYFYVSVVGGKVSVSRDIN